MEFIIIAGVCLAGLVVASYTDLKTREVPDWLNYGLIFTGLGLNGLFSLINKDFSFILYALIGLAIFVAFGYFMYYAGQWGGGDSKMLMGLGALLGFPLTFLDNFMLGFFVNILIVGAFYGMLWTFYIIVRNYKKFHPAFKKQLQKQQKMRTYVLALSFILIVLIFIVEAKSTKFYFIGLAAITYFTFYLFVTVRAVEKTCMLKMVTPKQLTEGDWIAKDVTIKGKYICGPKDLGISMKQIKLLIKKRVKKIQIKEGIPFVPSFLLAFLVTLWLGNVVLLFV